MIATIVLVAILYVLRHGVTVALFQDYALICKTYLTIALRSARLLKAGNKEPVSAMDRIATPTRSYIVEDEVSLFY